MAGWDANPPASAPGQASLRSPPAAARPSALDSLLVTGLNNRGVGTMRYVSPLSRLAARPCPPSTLAQTLPFSARTSTPRATTRPPTPALLLLLHLALDNRSPRCGLFPTVLHGAFVTCCPLPA